ncbi:pilus assembly protein [Cellulomonas fimi]|uniref:Pilus assembly protein n=1 Tax=Cellulomonas fimi TaxID=1708 RepID=A0A7Y0QH72_CELFI|nr:pilus assembly protein [Cellulomonas fimi]NMR20836.1 pilus assembly protein [Cellulomonas fimi]
MEFLAVTLLLLVPVVYLVLTLAKVQAATFAAEAAAREAGRAFTTAEATRAGTARAVAAVGLALGDQGFDEVDPVTALALDCAVDPCLTPGSDVGVRVTFDVALPGVPAFVQSVVPLSVTVDADHVASVDQYRAGG